MPAKGTRKGNPKGKAPQAQIGLPRKIYEALDELGKANGIINPRNKQGNRTRVIERLFAQLPVFNQAKIAIQMLLESHPQAKEYSSSVLAKIRGMDCLKFPSEHRSVNPRSDR